MHIVVVGANYRSCPIEVRERLAFPQDQLPHVLQAVRQDVDASEAAILSTCNRTEIYVAVPQLDGTRDRIADFLSRRSRIESAQLKSQLYALTEPASVRHLFTVASGLDSMVLGETEILSQVKQAYETARLHGATGRVLNVLFQKALNTGKAVQAHTGLGRGCVSVGSVAIELAQKIFGEVQRSTVALVGAGKIGELTLKRLVDRGVLDIRILNRSPERAHALSLRYGGLAGGLDLLSAQLCEADIVVTSVTADDPVITPAMVASAMPLRRHRPLYLIDLGVPRNIAAAVGQLENVYLFDIDDLQGFVAHAHRERHQAVTESHAIVDRKLAHFLTWWDKTAAAPCAPSSSVLAEAP